MALKSSPTRLPRRNHYQEGTGFLFVATQGGRPPARELPGTSAALVRRRGAALRRWAASEPGSAVAASVGVGRAHAVPLAGSYAQAGLAGLADPVRVGRASSLDPLLERVILMVRLLTNLNSRGMPRSSGVAACQSAPVRSTVYSRASGRTARPWRGYRDPAMSGMRPMSCGRSI